MIYVTLAALAVAITAIASTGQVLRSLIRQHARERQTLIDQMCHLSGRAWTPAPATQWEPPADDEQPFVRNVDQMPDEYDWSER